MLTMVATTQAVQGTILQLPLSKSQPIAIHRRLLASSSGNIIVRATAQSLSRLLLEETRVGSDVRLMAQ
jgi:hypothetical protein